MSASLTFHEDFVNRAYQEIDGINRTSLFTEQTVHIPDDQEIDKSSHAAFVTAINIYHAKGLLEEKYIYKALESTSSKDVRSLIKELAQQIK
jgi:hypothetical protein